MKKSQTPTDWIKEFHEFISAEAVTPPQALSESVAARIQGELNPPLLSVFLKLSGIHAVLGAVTLAFCPQFGFALTSGPGLMGPFMALGEQGCMVGCGAVFMGGSLLAASLVLKSDEVRAIRRTELLQISLLALLSLGVFVCAGVGVVAGLGLFWLLGSVVGGLGTFELGWALRRNLRARLYA